MKKNKVIFFLILIFSGILSRIITGVQISKGGLTLDLFALIALLSLTSGYTNFKKYVYLVPLFIMSISDIILYFIGIDSGFSSLNLILITAFVWSGFGIITFLGKFASKKTKRSSILLYTKAGIGGTILYDIWTNFGFWLGPFYSHNLSGLILCYTMAIPFMIEHLLTVMALIIPFYLVAKWARESIFNENIPAKSDSVNLAMDKLQIENF